MLWCVMDFKALCQAPSLLRFKRLIKRGKTVRIQIVHYQAHPHCLWVSFGEHALDPQRPVFPGSMLSGLHVALARQWFHFKENLGNTIADVFGVHPFRSSGRASYRLVHFPNELLTAFVHTDLRIIGVVRQMIDSDDIFHVCYERGAPLGRDFPILPEVRLKFVFLSMRCTVMWETLWARCNSMAFSARSRTVQRRRPPGDSEHAKAISRASKAPSKITSRDGCSGCLRSSATANPSSTKRFLRCSMVRGVTPMASAVSTTVHAGPCGPASQRSKARAKRNRFALVLPVFVRASSSWRSCSVKVTRYRGAMANPSSWNLP